MNAVINFLTGAPRIPTPTPVTSEPPAKGDGRFGNLLSDLWEREDQADDFLGDVSPAIAAAREGITNAVADMFNQHGLLARGTTATETAPSATAMPPIAVPVLPTAPATDSDMAVNDAGPVAHSSTHGPTPIGISSAADTSMPPQLRAVSQPTELSESRVGDAGPVGEGATPFAASQHVLAAAFRATPTMKVSVSRVPAVDAKVSDAEDIEFERAQPDRLEALQDGTTNAQLTLHMAEQGATVIARAIDGWQPGRQNLRDRLVAFLSRHGMRVGDVRLNGAPSSKVTEPCHEEP